MKDSATITTGEKLLIPMQVNALVVGKKKDSNPVTWKDLKIDFADIVKAENLGLSALSEPSVYENPDTRLIHKPGIHLHWVLPKAFRHGLQKEVNGHPVYPFIPNRWAVIRMNMQGNDFKSKTWIVESDTISGSNQHKNWMQLDNKGTEITEDDSYIPCSIGKSTPIKTWTETGTNNEPFLTIMAPGDPTFGASYTSCQGVLGFHDNMTGEPNGKYAFLIAGWYAQSEADILNGITKVEEWKTRMEKFSWGVDEDTEKLPDGSLCHAMIHSIDWKGKDHPYEYNIPTAKVDIGVGNSSIEALGALSKTKFSASQNAMLDDYSAIFQYGLLSRSKPEKAMEAMKEKFFNRAFKTYEGGSIWLLEKKETNKSTGPTEENLQVDEPLPTDISELLRDLNILQKTYDQYLRKLRASQWEIYATWYKSLWVWTTENEDQTKSEDQSNNLIKQQETKTLDLDTEINSGTPSKAEFTESISQKLNDLSLALKANSKYGNHIARKTKMPRFYEPKDPAIVISGIPAASIYSEEKNLKCRTSDQLVQGIFYERDDNPSIVNIFSKDLKINLLHDENNLKDDGTLIKDPLEELLKYLPKEINALFQEALWLNPEMSLRISKIVNDQAGIDNITSLSSEIASNIKNLKNEIFRTKDDKPAMVPNKKTVISWRQPWIPLFLEWEVDRIPSMTSASADSLASKWNFGEGYSNIEFELKSIPPELSTPVVEHRGRLPLAQDLGKSIATLLETFPSLEEGGYLKDWVPLSQSLGGFHDQMIMRKGSIQFPPLLYNETNNLFDKVDPLVKIIEDQYHLHPMPEQQGFTPLRGGYFTIKTLRIIDAFGQVKSIDLTDLDNIHVSKDLNTITEASKKYIQITPRLVQPSRLLFRWQAANIPDRETDSDLATSPVCGWFLPNHLDNSLMIYDADGTACGSLKLRGNPQEGGSSFVTSFIAPSQEGKTNLGSCIKNNYLKNLVNMLVSNNDAAVLQDLLILMNSINDKVETQGAPQEGMIPIPIGSPIAVVKASLNLELGSEPARSQDVDQYSSNPPPAKPPFTDTNFPVRIGDFYKKKDGLVGFFQADNFNNMFLPFGCDKNFNSNNSYFRRDQQQLNLNLSWNQEHAKSKTKTFILLMDPRMGIHANTGILPSKYIALPPTMVAHALKQMEIGYYVHSLLTPKDKLMLPLAKLSNKNWHWYSQTSKDTELWEEQSPGENLSGLLSFESLQLTEGWLNVKQK